MMIEKIGTPAMLEQLAEEMGGKEGSRRKGWKQAPGGIW